jgi:hypothetical protein
VIKDANLKIQARSCLFNTIMYIPGLYKLKVFFDSDSNKTITKKMRPKGPKLCSAKGMASLHLCADNS